MASSRCRSDWWERLPGWDRPCWWRQRWWWRRPGWRGPTRGSRTPTCRPAGRRRWCSGSPRRSRPPWSAWTSTFRLTSPCSGSTRLPDGAAPADRVSCTSTAATCRRGRTSSSPSPGSSPTRRWSPCPVTTRQADGTERRWDGKPSAVSPAALLFPGYPRGHAPVPGAGTTTPSGRSLLTWGGRLVVVAGALTLIGLALARRRRAGRRAVAPATPVGDG